MTAKRDRQNVQETPDSGEAGICDVTPLCTDDNVLSHPTRNSRDAELEQFRRSIADLSLSELKQQYPREFNCFRAMKQREREGKCTVQPNLQHFAGFLSVLGPQPAPTMTVDRINNEDREYAPGNVRWATKRTQANNRTNTVILTDKNGVSRPLTEWARLTKQKPNTMRQRHGRGWSDAEVIDGEKTTSGSASRGAGKAFWPVAEDEKQAWEQAYQRVWRHYHYHPGLTRRVFLVWMVRNRAYHYLVYLERRYPHEIGYESGGADVVEARQDPRYSRSENCTKIMRRDMPEINKNPHEREMSERLWRRPDRPFQPWDID